MVAGGWVQDASGWGRGESWAPADPARGQCRPVYKSDECSPWCRSLPLWGTSPASSVFFHLLPVRSQFSLVWDRKVNREPGDGVQLRRHRGGGGQVPRPRPPPPPPPQHDADRRGGVAQDDAEELVVRLVRPQPRPRPPRRRAQVRVRAGHARRLLQVPPPPWPPGVPSVPGHLRRGAAAGRGHGLLPHRRGAVTAPVSLSTKKRRRPSSRRGEEKRETGKGKRTHPPLCDTTKGAYLFLPSSSCQWRKFSFPFTFFPPVFVVGIDRISLSLECSCLPFPFFPSLHLKKFPCLY